MGEFAYFPLSDKPYSVYLYFARWRYHLLQVCIETVEKLPSERLMENAHPAGTKSRGIRRT